MSNQLPTNYLTRSQAVEKFDFLTENMLKNWLFENTDQFRTKVAKKIGRRIFLCEEALLRFFWEAQAIDNSNEQQ